ncbi:MAG: AMP-binding protein [Verrucomicrobiota bacterium]
MYPRGEGEVDSAVLDVFADDAVDVVKLTPSHLSLVLEHGKPVQRIRRLILGGEDLRVPTARAALDRLRSRIEIINEYGPTEAVVGCMIHRFDPADDLDGSVPIGQPADGVSLQVVNRALQPVPPGVPGELCIARPGLTAGYLNRPSLNKTSFINGDSRWYRSGDLARLNQRGQLVYLGRVDRQVKVRGHRVEPGELESILLDVPGVVQCSVTTFSPNRKRAPDAPPCTRCGIEAGYPDMDFDEEGVCSICRRYDDYAERAAAYFKTPRDFEQLISQKAPPAKGEYDCMMLTSGGKDSTYALGRLVDMGLRVYAFTLDNGYLSDQAKANISRVVEALGVTHELAETPEMKRIFRDSLQRFSNVCQGCFKTVYTLALKRAFDLGIPTVITGLSRGQFFETRLAESVFAGEDFDPDQVDRAIFEARKAYHRAEDLIRRSLDTDCFQDDQIFEAVQVVDFYRYHDVSLQALYDYLEQRMPWRRPSDTGRSTNCRINEVGIYVHRKERGYHNYALPYSWDVRLGHKTRDQALYELNDEIEETDVHKILKEVEYNISPGEDGLSLAVYYVSDREINPGELRDRLRRFVPPAVLPDSYIPVNTMPLTANGKIDIEKLPDPASGLQAEGTGGRAPESEAEQRIAEIWEGVLHRSPIGAEESFFDVGGHSLLAMEVMFRLRTFFDLELPLELIFTAPTVAELAEQVEDALLQEIEALDENEAVRLAEGEDP